MFAWVIKGPDGKILTGTISMISYNECIHRFVNGNIAYWDYIYDYGYRCVRIEIQEVD
jgi:hypothetical protein